MFPKFNLFRISSREPGGAGRGGAATLERCGGAVVMFPGRNNALSSIYHSQCEGTAVNINRYPAQAAAASSPPPGRFCPMENSSAHWQDLRNCKMFPKSFPDPPTALPRFTRLQLITKRLFPTGSLEFNFLALDENQTDMLYKLTPGRGKAKKSFDPELYCYKACFAALLSNLTSVCLFVLQFGQKYKQLANLLSSALKTVNTNSQEKIIHQVSHHLCFHLFLCALSYGG